MPDVNDLKQKRHRLLKEAHINAVVMEAAKRCLLSISLTPPEISAKWEVSTENREILESQCWEWSGTINRAEPECIFLSF